MLVVFPEWIVYISLFEYDAPFYYIIYKYTEKFLISINFAPLQMEPMKLIVFQYMLVAQWSVI